MDTRNRRAVIDPKFRQVGFVTPSPDVPEAAVGVPVQGIVKEAPVVASSSPSPVMIPPPRPVIEIPQKTEPVPVPSPSHKKPPEEEVPSAPLGSYNPPDSVLDSSSGPSSKGGALRLSIELFSITNVSVGLITDVSCEKKHTRDCNTMRGMQRRVLCRHCCEVTKPRMLRIRSLVALSASH